MEQLILVKLVVLLFNASNVEFLDTLTIYLLQLLMVKMNGVFFILMMVLMLKFIKMVCY